ncbi:unnamed protein product [Pedinophyceae sp. YPF-701]|nr:unnamed protein product [Pedinophyceae sp. YPF-701]
MDSKAQPSKKPSLLSQAMKQQAQPSKGSVAETNVDDFVIPEPHNADRAYEMARSYLVSPQVLTGSVMPSSVDVASSIAMSPKAVDLRNMIKPGGTTSNRVRENSERGQEIRLKLLRDSVIVFITAGYSGKRFVFEQAKRLGVRTVIVESPDSWSRKLVDEGIIEKFVAIDMDESDTLMQRILDRLNDVAKELGHIDGITTFCEMAVPLVSRLSEIFNLPCNPKDAVDVARDKHKFRRAMADAGLPSPASHSIHGPEDLSAAADVVGFPAVIKPVAGAASLGVVRVDSPEELRTAYEKVIKEMCSYKVSSGALEKVEEENLPEADPAAGPAKANNAASWIDLTMMMEEYLDGEEVDVDVVMAEGKAVYGAITDNWPTIEPYFNETGSNCPSILPSYQQRELLELAVQGCKSLGLKLGVFHVEAKYTSRGPRLIEINCRMGGGPVHLTNRLVWGVDLVDEHLMASVGIPVRPQIAEKPLRCIAEYSINAPRSGYMAHTRYMNKWVGHPSVLYARPLVSQGDKVVCKEEGMPTWVCEIMVSMPTVQEGIEFVKEVERELELPIVSKKPVIEKK